MALMTINYLSPSLGMQQSFVAIIPEDASFFDETQSPKSYKSLMLCMDYQVMQRRIHALPVLSDMQMNIN